MIRTWPGWRGRWLRTLMWLAALALLIGVLQTVSLAKVGTVLGRLGIGAALALVMANGLALVTMTGRWWLLLRLEGYSIPYLTMVGYRLAAFGVSYFTPGPQFGGEPLQVYLVRRHHRVPTETAIAAVTLDKLLELLVNFSFLAGGAGLIARQQLVATPVAGVLVAFSVSLLALPIGLMAMLASGQRPLACLLRLVQPFFGRWPQRFETALVITRAAENQTTAFYRQHPGGLVLALTASTVSWAVLVGEYWLMLQLLGAELTLLQTLAALTAARLAILFPLPGGLGVLEASQVVAMTVLGLDPAIGLSAGALIRLRDVLLGGLGLWWGGTKS